MMERTQKQTKNLTRRSTGKIDLGICGSNVFRIIVSAVLQHGRHNDRW